MFKKGFLDIVRFLFLAYITKILKQKYTFHQNMFASKFLQDVPMGLFC